MGDANYPREDNEILSSCTIQNFIPFSIISIELLNNCD
jgi:hypothetical protein